MSNVVAFNSNVYRTAVDYYDRITSLHTDLTEAYTLLKKTQQALDKRVSALYHDLEANDIDEAGGYGRALELQKVLRERRVVKDELLKVQCVFNTLNPIVPELTEAFNKRQSKSRELCDSLNVKMHVAEVMVR